MTETTEDYLVKILIPENGDVRIVDRKTYGKIFNHVEFVENVYPEVKPKPKPKAKAKAKTSKKED